MAALTPGPDSQEGRKSIAPATALVRTEAMAVASTATMMTRKPARFASWLTTGLWGRVTMPNMARTPFFSAPISPIAE